MKKRGHHEHKAAKSRQHESNATENKKNEKKTDKEEKTVNDDIENEGFSDWLRSSDGIEMMRLFVFANAILIIVTMGWPKMQEAITSFKEYINVLQLALRFPKRNLLQILRFLTNLREKRTERKATMLGLLFRGVFLIGILTWYSTSVWKMIDGYFRDQFRSYLEEEYRKNPRMKSDLAAGSAGSVAPVSTTPRPAATVPPPQEIPEGSVSDDAVEAAENDSASIAAKEKEEVTGGSSENEAAWGTTDKNAFLGTDAESGLESRKSPESELESRRLINHGDRDPEEASHGDGHRSVAYAFKSPARRIKLDKKSTAPKDISRGNRLPRAGTLKTIIFTEKDYKQVKKNDFSKDDFWEFEEDALEKESSEGILVSELPFKPRLDIGDLERVTADEYCPLTLEDEASCEETVKWP